ncbi:phytochrome A-associated F-box protein isoform X2 [Solanum dulcamara]|uniref:phytochrome A-associated F-box protein isoform X2 n=1 Tax=Solanum dulcamara TaxID=45834 RepID=UPI002486859A|nr:phytochrome A-associated F-box protein isoform X2 [Solanum dulcamara]
MSNSFIVDGFFSKISEDLVLNILFKLEDDPRNWARLSCVSTKFAFLIHSICYKSKCSLTIPSVVSDLVNGPSSSMASPGGWSSLYKLAVCCPGLHQAGVLLENSDFGLERELGPDENYADRVLPKPDSLQTQLMPSSSNNNRSDSTEVADCGWSLFDDLMFDTVYDASESTSNQPEIVEEESPNLVVTPTRVLNNLLRYSLANTNKKGDIGSPCRKPFSASKGGAGTPLITIEYVTVLMQVIIHLTNKSGNCKLSRICLRYTHSSESYAF